MNLFTITIKRKTSNWCSCLTFLFETNSWPKKLTKDIVDSGVSLIYIMSRTKFSSAHVVRGTDNLYVY